MFIIPITQMPSLSSINSAQKGAPEPQAKAHLPFADIFKDVLTNLEATQKVSDRDAYALAMGTTDDLHTVVINSEKAATALELTVQLTSKAVTAYNEIMRMQV